MSKSHTLRTVYAADGIPVSDITNTITDDEESLFSGAVATATTQEVDIAFAFANLKSAWIVADQAMLLGTNNAPLYPPIAPVPTTAASGGTVLAGVYGVEVTYVNAAGETTGSVAGTVTTTGSVSTITIPSPIAATGATGWYAYVTQVGGSTYTRQQTPGSPTAIGTALTITAPPSSGGANPPAANTSAVQVFTLGVNQPLFWNNLLSSANPFTSNVTKFYLVNASGFTANPQMAFIIHT